jgi:hypothetical protein
MKWFFLLLFFFAGTLSGCGLKDRESAVREKEAELTQREQALAEKEKTLQLQEEALLAKERKLNQADSTTKITASVYNPALVGQWTARMVCTETSCTGSAIGDTKTETWELSYQNDQVIAQAKDGEVLIRTYTGALRNNFLELTENVGPSAAGPATRMLVRLAFINETTMEGEREIIRSGNCRIVYALQLQKK